MDHYKKQAIIKLSYEGSYATSSLVLGLFLSNESSNQTKYHTMQSSYMLIYCEI